MKVSIVTVVLNNRPHIEDCIRSVLGQSYKNFEYIIIDGGSTDGTLDIIRNYEQGMSHWVSEKDDGIYDAMNKGIKSATGDIVGILNSDDFYAHADVLDTVVRVMKDNSIDACYADLEYVDKDDADTVVRYWRSSPYQAGLFTIGWVPPHPTFFARRSVYEKYGIFNLKYRLAADFELLARLLEHYEITTRYIPETMIKMRTGGVTNRSYLNIIRQNVEIFRACRENDIRISPVRFVLSKIMTRIHQFRQGGK